MLFRFKYPLKQWLKKCIQVFFFSKRKTDKNKLTFHTIYSIIILIIYVRVCVYTYTLMSCSNNSQRYLLCILLALLESVQDGNNEPQLLSFFPSDFKKTFIPCN